jgi:hypothetical protein
VDLVIADCQLPIFDCRLGDRANWQSAIANRKSGDPPLSRGGTDFITSSDLEAATR